MGGIRMHLLYIMSRLRGKVPAHQSIKTQRLPNILALSKVYHPHQLKEGANESTVSTTVRTSATPTTVIAVMFNIARPVTVKTITIIRKSTTVIRKTTVMNLSIINLDRTLRNRKSSWPHHVYNKLKEDPFLTRKVLNLVGTTTMRKGTTPNDT